jgi:4-hydroxyphenylacetate 3-monooxygenase
MIKTGAQHTAALQDGRQVYINGRLAGDVTIHPAFRRTVQSIGTLYDFQAQPENRGLMTFEVPEGGGGRANRIWQLPHSYADLVERRRLWRPGRNCNSPRGIRSTRCSTQALPS